MSNNGHTTLERMQALTPGDVRAFWRWVQELNNQQGIVRSACGRLVPPSLNNLATRAGVVSVTLAKNISSNRVPSMDLMTSLAPCLGITLDEIRERIPLRYTVTEADYCLTCPLPDCNDELEDCPLRVAISTCHAVELAARAIGTGE